MTNENHNKLIAWLFIGFGCFSSLNILVSLATAYLNWEEYEKVFSMMNKNQDFPFQVFFYIIGFFIIFGFVSSILDIMAGIGMLKKQRWGRMLGIIAGVLSLIAIPIGTIQGIYALWFLMGENGKQYYLKD